MDPTIRCNEICEKFLAINDDENLHKQVIGIYEWPVNYCDIRKIIKITEEGKIARSPEEFYENNKNYCSWNVSNTIKSIELIQMFYSSLVGSLEQPEDRINKPYNSPSDHLCRRIGQIVLNHCNIFDHEIIEKKVSGKELFQVFDTMKNTLGENYFKNLSHLLIPSRFFCFFVEFFNDELEKRKYLFDKCRYTSRTLSSFVDRMYLKIIKENGQVFASIFQIRDFKIQRRVGWEKGEDIMEPKYVVFRIDVNLITEERLSYKNTKVAHFVALFDNLKMAKSYINQSGCEFPNKVFNILNKNRDTNMTFRFVTKKRKFDSIEH